jgi:transposase-like protein
MGIKKTRRKFSSEFKAKVALEALTERSSISELSKKYDLHPNVIHGWKQALQTNSSRVFSEFNREKASETDQLIGELYKQIGQLKVDNDWLKKKLL